MHQVVRILVGVLLACLCLNAWSKPGPIEITPASPIQAHFEFWEDVTGAASLEHVASLPDERWSLVPEGRATFGLTQSAYWLRFSVRNPTPIHQNLIAELAYSQLDDVVFHVLDDGVAVKTLRTGDSQAFYPRDVDYPSMLLRVPLAPGEMKAVFVRIATSGSMVVPLMIWREQAFFESAANELKLHFFYYGCIFVIILINLAVFLSLRERLYLYYALALVGYLLFFASIKGFSFQHLYPGLPQLHARMLLISIPALALFSLLFCREFLNTRVSTPRLDKLLIGMMVFELLFLFCAPFLDYYRGIQLASFSALVFFSLLLAAGPIAWAAGVRAGVFFTLAWTPLTIGVMATAGRALGVFPENFFTENAMQLGSGIEAFILTLALADRLYREREDKIIAQAASLQEAQSRNVAQKQLTEALTHDPVTGLPNRNRFELMVDQQLQQHPQRHYMVGLARITRLDEINRTLGLARSEWVMKCVARQMAELAAGLPFIHVSLDDQGREERVYHLSGDCFCLLVDMDSADNDFAALNRALRRLAEPLQLDHLAIELRPRFGAAAYPQHGQSAAELIRNAHVGMEIAPRSGNETGIYSSKYDIYSESRLTLMTDLRNALQQGQLMLHYQPKQNIASAQIEGIEALVRWHHAERGWVNPADFIPLAEETGMISQLTHWVIQQATRDLADLRQTYPALTVAINLSARDLESANLRTVLEMARQHHRLPADAITLEITETAAMRDPESSLQALNGLAALGYKISIDDFGSGYSSLSYLKQLPASELKLDRSLIHDICTSENADVIVSTTIQMAHGLGYRVVGEGIENRETANRLKTGHCDSLQGFWLCRPAPIEELRQWLAEFDSAQ